MALNDNAVLKPNTAHFYTNTTDDAATVTLPEDLRNPGVGWEHMGHTSLEDILSATTEGGEQSILPSLQNRQLRTARNAATTSFRVNLLQLDPNSARLYFGSNAVIDADNRVVSVPADPQPFECAWLCVMYDGTNDAGYFARRAEIVRGEDLSISDTESLAQLPVQITPLSIGDGGTPYDFILPHAHIEPAGV